VIEQIKDIDTSLFLFLNGLHNHFFDVLMYCIAGKYTWIPFYALLLFFVYKKFKSRTWYILIAVTILIWMSDQLSVHLFKEVFQRYRPCHNLIIQQQVHVVGNCGGTYGFISSHASNTFALAIFLSLIFRQSARKLFYVLVVWASIVSYSRIYLGVHYPADVAVGALFGSLLGILIYLIYTYVMDKFVKALELNNGNE
jgi:undecaprenyl-diphosphatase